MSESTYIRRAQPDEAALLGDMTIAGVGYWEHDVNFPEAVEGLRTTGLPTPEYIEASPVFVLEQDGNPIGFYGLKQNDDFIDLRYMFLNTDRIGKGHGRELWNHAVAEAAALSRRMRILSDPSSHGFYSAMGAILEKEVEVSPGFRLGVFWYQLGSA